MNHIKNRLSSIYRTNPDAFSVEDIISLSCDMAADLVLFKGEGGIEEEHERIDTLLLTRIGCRIASCTLCGRCQNKTQTVLGEGTREASLFIVIPEPTWVDDRTGIPLSGLFEIRASRCSGCTHFNSCYEKLYSGDPVTVYDRCSYTKEGNTNNIKQNLLKESPIPMPGRTLDKTLRSMDEGRPAWNKMAALLYSYNIGPLHSFPSRVYITSAVKCYSPNKATRPEREACSPWLHIERSFIKAPVTLAIGEDSMKSIFSDSIDPTTWNNGDEVTGWGRVYYLKDIEDPELMDTIKECLK